MQDASSAFVPGSEASIVNTMDTQSVTSFEDRPAIGMTDERLMEAFKRGNADAFNELFSRYRQPVIGFFMRRALQPAQAEELTQETLLAVLRASARYEPTALFRTYLYSIAFRILQVHRRKHAFRATFLGTAERDSEPQIQSSIIACVLVREAIAKISLLDREILMLREYEQLSYSEIAGLLELPVNTVRSRLFRARAALRNILAASVPKSSTATLTQFKEGI